MVCAIRRLISHKKESGKRRLTIRRNMSSSISLPSFRLPSKAKFWKKRRSEDLGDSDPSYRAIYLGNVLTGWAKGDGCIDKPLATLWKNHIGTDKPSIVMKVTVCGSGLKAVTKEHGLTEYWANRITYSAADPAYPKVFCWIYRHEGRKLKQELRCHAVLCPSASKARFMSERLKERLHQALIDFKKEKVWRQNARLSLANSTCDNPTMPYRKVLCSVSGNYRPPIERGKAAPKLKIIEEAIVEEDESISEESHGEEEVITSTGVNQRAIDCPTNQLTSEASYSSFDNGLIVGLIDEDSSTNYKRLSVCSDNLSVVTTETTVISEPDMSVDPHSSSAHPNTQIISISEGQLIDVSDDPRPRPKPAPRTSLGKTSFSSSSEVPATCKDDANICGITITNGCDPKVDNCESSDEEEEDIVTNYLDKMSIDQQNQLLLDNQQLRANSYSSHSPDSHRFSTKSDSSVVGDNDEMEDDEDGKRNEMVVLTRSMAGVTHDVVMESKIASSKGDQDTISDESGYSEDSNAISTANCPLSSSTSPEVTVKLIDKMFAKDNNNGANINKNTPTATATSKLSSDPSNIIITQTHTDNVSHDKPFDELSKITDSSLANNGDTQVQEDPTVHGVLISDFSTSERLKYLERSRQMSAESKLSASANPPDFFQNKIQEFVINI